MTKKRVPTVVRGRDREPQPKGEPSRKPEPETKGTRKRRRPKITPAWIDAARTKDAATRVATALAKHAVWKPAFDGALPSPEGAVLVQRLDREDEYYYIVTFMKGTRTTARMALVGRSGKLLRCNAVSRANRSLPKFVAPADVLKSREGKPYGIGPARERLVRMAAIGVAPVLSWKPCAESQSPLLPFYVLTVGDSVTYLRVDGKLNHVLTLAALGR